MLLKCFLGNLGGVAVAVLLGVATASGEGLPAETGAAEGKTDTKDENGTKRKNKEAETGSPWKVGSTGRYSWKSGRRLVGRTTFTIEEEPSADAQFAVRSHFEFEKGTTKLDIRRRCVFNRRWSLVRYESTSNVLSSDRSATTRATGWLEGREFVTETVPNGREDRKTRSALRLPRGGVDILLPQAIELWAVYAPHRFPTADGATIQLAYPYFDRVYSIKVTVAGDESLDLGEELVECRRYHLQSEEKQIDEEIWVDRQGRMLRYRKGELTIELQPDSPPARADDRARGKTEKADG